MERYPVSYTHLVTLQNACEKQVLNICVSLFIHLEVDFDALARAVRRAVERDDSVRVRFTRGADGTARQYIVPADDRPVRHVDLSRMTESEAMLELHRWSRQPFEPRWDAPLFEIVTVAMPDGWNGAFVRIDHMLSCLLYTSTSTSRPCGTGFGPSCASTHFGSFKIYEIIRFPHRRWDG